MKRYFCFCMLIMSFFIYSVSYGEEILRMATSAQIAEAFGMDVVKEFEQKHNIKVKVFKCSSDTALERVVNGFSDIACVANRIPTTYREQGYIEIPFARDPLAIIVNSQNPVNNIDEKQLIKIFTGQLNSWKKLGGVDGEIFTIIPDQRTALFKNFQFLIMKDLPVSWDFKSYLSINVVTLVSHLKEGISIISSGALKNKDGYKILKVNNKDVTDKDYPYFQIFSFVTKGVPNRAAREFINAALSKRGKEIIVSKGMYPIFDKD